MNKIKTLNEYQDATDQLVVYKPDNAFSYCLLGLCSEAGEVASKAKKYLRGDSRLDRDGMIDELGDVLWYIAQLSGLLSCDLSTIATRNIEKLNDRKMRNVIKGDGDAR